MLVISLQRELPFAAMTRNRRFIGIAGVLGALGFWSTLPARAEEPAKPAQAAALPSESDELKALRLAAEKAKKALPAAQAVVALEAKKPLKTEGVQQACAIRQQAAAQARESCDARCESGHTQCTDYAQHRAAHRACFQQKESCDNRCVATQTQVDAACEKAVDAAKASDAIDTERYQNAVAKADSLLDTVDSYKRARPWPDAAQCPTGMLPIPPGTFRMGDAVNTSKAGQVTVAGFCMDTTEVTTAAYAACVASGKCTRAERFAFCNAGVAGRENHPINCVDWNQAKAYCDAQGQRLPTEEEWEYAATGGDGRTYPWGDDEPSNQLCWNGEGNDLGKGNRQSTCAVGSYPNGNSPFRLADMSGNVWEWTSSGASNSYSSPRDEGYRMVRGGDRHNDEPTDVRAARRWVHAQENQLYFLGFRCAGSPLP